MVSYYRKHYGDLYAGHVARAEDINFCQQNTADAIDNAIDDINEGQGCIIGSDENAFILTPEKTTIGRFIDQINLAEGSDAKYISIRQKTYKQAIKLSRSSLYSVIVKMQNLSELDVNVEFELHDMQNNLIEGKKATLLLPANTTPTEYEIVFDLDYYPTQHGIKPEDLRQNNPTMLIPPNNTNNDTQGTDYGDENSMSHSSLGASVIYLVVKALNTTRFDINQNQENYVWNDTDPTFGILMNKNSEYGQLLEENNGSGFIPSTIPGDLYFKEIYTNSQSYHCEYGEAIIKGGKVCLADTHVSVEGASSYGDVVSYIYMDQEGSLKVINSLPFTGERPDIQRPDEAHLHIANIITYADPDKDPVIEQDDTNQDTRLRSHHERLRRLEKEMLYTQDVAIPPRLKYTLTGETWIDENPEKLLYEALKPNNINTEVAQAIDALEKSGYIVTTDADGNFVIKVSKTETVNIPITLKSKTSGVTETKNEKTVIKSAQTTSYINALSADDTTRAKTFAEIKNMDINISDGIMTLANTNKDANVTVATTSKQAKETEFNPWDDSAENRPASSDVKPTEREYKITSGKNGRNDWASEFPAMTLFLSSNYKMKKLQIPIHKFKNCTGVKFFIYKRQQNNDKKNTVWLQKRMWVTDVFSLKKAKEKKGYQYMDDGFLINFGKKGLTLPKGQYVIIALPIVKSGTGSVFVETYKPKNSKDFCIRYYGAANASHFLLKTRYQEIWYNSAKAIGEKISYATKGHVTSGTVTWENKEPIKSVKALGNITKDKNTSYTIEVDAGSGWQEVKLKEVTEINSGKNSFRWRITFKGDKEGTPTLKYNKKNKYALKFEIIRATPNTSNNAQVNTLDQNLCITSKPFDGNKILREYLGDSNFAYDDNKFSNFEFARVWAEDNTKKELRIDLSGSDYYPEVKDTNGKSQGFYTIYSFHYVDLKLEDFNSGSVDYSNYDPIMELDEHNLRLKLDTEYSYNDNDIQILSLTQFKPTNKDYILATTTNKDDEEESSATNNNSTTTTTKQAVKITNIGYSDNSVYGTLTTADNTPINNVKIKINAVNSESIIQATTNSSGNFRASYNANNNDVHISYEGDDSYYSYSINYKIDTNTTYNIIDGAPQTTTENETSDDTEETTETITSEIKVESIDVDLTKVPESTDNITLVKAKLDSPLNLAQYDAIKLGLSINGTVGGTLSGVALYISSTYESETPSNIKSEPDERVILVDTLPDLNSSQQETIDKYANQIVKRYEPRNGTAGYVYYQSIWNSTTAQWTWQLLHTTKSFNIYEIINRTSNDTKLTITEQNNNKKQYYEIYIDPQNTNLQYAKEIGLILLNDENKYKNTNVQSISLHEFATIQQDYYPIFDASAGDVFEMKTSSADTVSKANASGSISQVKTTKPETSQIIMNYNTDASDKPTDIKSSGSVIAEFSAISKNTANYNHIGIQLSSDCLLVKNMLELHLIQVDDTTKVETVIDKINLPTMNYMYYYTTANNQINLTQVFKKLETNERFDKIALVATPKFLEYAEKLKTIKNTTNNEDEKTNGIDGNKSISLFIGKISLYQARTLPMFHRRMRMKFYFDKTTEAKRDSINIRKIGVVADYQ